MNLGLGGKNTPKMRNGFNYTTNQSQSMVFPSDHPDFPDLPKGIKQVLLERGLWNDGLRLQCKNKCTGQGIYPESSFELNFINIKSSPQLLCPQAVVIRTRLPRTKRYDTGSN